MNVQLDDGILAMFLRLSGPSDSSVKHICMPEALSSEAEDFMDSSFLVRRFIFQGISIDCDVHLSKSPWLPIAIDASRCVLLSILWLLKFRTLLCSRNTGILSTSCDFDCAGQN